MSWDDYIDTEIVNSPTFWGIYLIVGFLFIVGYKMQSVWGQGQMPIYYVPLTLLLMPVGLYMVLKYWILR